MQLAHRHSATRALPTRNDSIHDSFRATHSRLWSGGQRQRPDMDAPRDLAAQIGPAELVYIVHHGWPAATASQRKAAAARIEAAVVCCEPVSTEYARDVITVWACLQQNTRERPSQQHPASTPLSAAAPTLKTAALAILSGHTSVAQLSFVRHQLCQQNGRDFFFATLATATPAVKNTHIEKLKLLAERFSGDCTFAVTGDWMLDAKTTLLCTPWKVCITDGNEAPFKVAAAEHQERLNEMLRPIIKVPITMQLAEILPVDDSDNAFIVLIALMQELAPGTRVAINGDIFYHTGCKHPVPFYLKGFPIPNLLEADCYGIILGRCLLIYNGRGVYQMATEWLYLAMITGYPGAEDAANFVFGGAAVSDGNPLLKYAPETQSKK